MGGGAETPPNPGLTTLRRCRYASDALPSGSNGRETFEKSGMSRISAPDQRKRRYRRAACELLLARTDASHAAGLDARPQAVLLDGVGGPSRRDRRRRRSLRRARPCTLTLPQSGRPDALRGLHGPRRAGLGAAHAGERARRPHPDRRARSSGGYRCTPSALAMLLLTARPGYSAPVLAALAHFRRTCGEPVPARVPAAGPLARAAADLDAGARACTSARRSPPRARPRSAWRRCSQSWSRCWRRGRGVQLLPELEARMVTSSLVSTYAV